jgi:diguanylate cyclase (GGDEF)-like protein
MADCRSPIASATIPAMSLFRSLRQLEEQGIDLIEVLGQDAHIRSPDDLRAIIRSLERAGDELHSELLHFLTYRWFPPAQATALWDAILRHRRRMADRLGRPVKFRVAALDYLTGKNPRLEGVRIIAREEMDALLARLHTDEVTGLHTRRYFNERIGAELNRARRYGSSLSLLVLDLDDFKRVNDELGHLSGDALLRRIGRTLRENTRESDIVCRFGGDEFAALLPETNNSEAYTLAERIRKATAAEARAEIEGAAGTRDGPPIRVGVSIGGATYPADCEEAEELVALADRLCLEAKREGKNRVRMSGDRPREAPGGSPAGRLGPAAP